MSFDCILVNRVSSADQKDGYSLSAQSRYGNTYLSEKRLKLLQEFTFQESASKASEQKHFDQILSFITSYCAKSKKPLHVVVEKKDRWGRLHSRKEFIQSLVLEGKVVVHYYREAQIFDQNCSPEDIFMDDVVTSMNKYTALNIGREAKKGMKEKAEEGWLPHKPPPGYLNNVGEDSKTKPILINESERQWVYRMFELRGKERLSYGAITEKVKQEGLVPARRLQSFRKNYTERILKNSFYAGKIVWAGKEYVGKHDLIIPSSLHRQVVASFDERGQLLKRRQDALFADVFRCGDENCGCKISYHQKHKPSGRVYHLYICANGKKVHKSLKGKYLKQDEILNELGSAVDEISITKQMADQVAAALSENDKSLQEKLNREISSFKSGLRQLEVQEDQLYTHLCQGVVTNDMYQRRIAQIREQRDKYTNLILDLQSSATATYRKTAHEILELCKDAKRLWLSRTDAERADFLKKILWNPRITGTTIEYELRKPFNVVAKMNQSKEWGG